MEKENIKSILESLLFVNEKPIQLSDISRILEIKSKDIKQAVEELKTEYSNRNSGISIVPVAGGYQMCSAPFNEPWVKKMYSHQNKQKLSTASLETLAIIAYKQPITRVEIEQIRGVNVDGVVRKLGELGLIKTAGKKEVVGRPFLYITTRKFLEYFGINTLKDLPNLEEFVNLAEKENIVSQEESQDQQNKIKENKEQEKNKEEKEE
ncbi:MAG: SMC-Scp complex subunit ScpB [Candidatus Omnitrophica bacterium]|nr:SMC-Scp complex subunit ScpB [Candidatus Omnitrophota bacterium]MCF7894238.1 SMC-Scp complex subunit ScpB [Candidatus Omnitrophota bacterium]